MAIVGATGAGKSTLVHLIPRFYDPTSGVHPHRWLRYSRTRPPRTAPLRRHDLPGDRALQRHGHRTTSPTAGPTPTPQQVVAAARAAHAHDFITELENGYDTVIGERGVSLSGGQKQRLAIARAFLLDPRILILDDATSSLDAKTERLIQEDMRRVCLGRTAFVIAHRLTTVQHADQVIVLRNGRIVEQGTPAPN